MNGYMMRDTKGMLALCGSLRDSCVGCLPLCFECGMYSHVAAKVMIVVSKGLCLRQNSLEPDRSKQGGWREGEREREE